MLQYEPSVIYHLYKTIRQTNLLNLDNKTMLLLA